MKKLTALIVTLLIAAVASVNADLYNFGGTDISGESGWGEYTYGEVAYSASLGYGWTFNAEEDGYANILVDRGAEGNSDRNLETTHIEVRGYGSVSTDNDYLTFRVDLDPGTYTINVTVGDDNSFTRNQIIVGDVFNTAGNTGAIDKEDPSSQLIFGADYASGGCAQGTHKVATGNFTVDQGYVLIGFRRYYGTDQDWDGFGGMNQIEIVPEPMSLIVMLGGGAFALIRRRR